MSLAQVVEQYDWYSEEEILNPSGYGAKVYAALVKKKIAHTLKFEKEIDVNVGVLVNDPTSNETQTPIAIICEFQSEIDIATLNLTHKLSWNFCRSPLLIIVEPDQVRALSCYIKPEDSELAKNKDQLLFGTPLNQEKHKAQIVQFPINKTHSAHQAAESLRWIDLYSGQFILEQEKKGYFPNQQRVDYMLLENLKFIRKELIKLNLEEDIVHDLLARLIFIQFLFQRQDSDGNPAIDDKFLKERFKDGTLSKKYEKLEEILRDKNDTYNFFRWLNKKFNGDLFPGRGETDEQREAEWKQEMARVKKKHLDTLANFISGKVRMENGQLCLWERYSFDVIPLEFISSIYEVFVNKEKGVHYTPSLLVDFILDNPEILPWNGTKWDLKILDPACGSGIFLVKTFQRLVQRWKNSNPDKKPSETFLTGLLANNLYGIDVNPHAVRVAAFSLYLALCDEIDPRLFWVKWEFPPMRDERIIERDFFDDLPLFEKKYDLIIGNAPWGKSEAKKSKYVKSWTEKFNWEIPYEDIGPLFLPKSASMLNLDGKVAMLQPVNSLLFNQSGKCIAFREKFFTSYKVFDIVNLSVLRYALFSDSISPSCVVVLSNSLPDGTPINYTCPKGTKTKQDIERILVEHNDRNRIYPAEAIKNPLIWTTLMWGGRRDLKLIQDLGQHISLNKIQKQENSAIKKRQGLIRGSRTKDQGEQIMHRRILESSNFPEDSFIYLDADQLPLNEDPMTDYKASTNFSSFKFPQLILKKSWQVGKRFQARLVKDKKREGILCNTIFISVHTPKIKDKDILESAFLSYNSKLAVYYLLLTSGQFATFIPKIEDIRLMSVPIPTPRPNLLKGIKNIQDIDDRIYELFDFKDSEKILIEDLFNFTLPDFKGNINSPGRQKTQRLNEPDLTTYCNFFRRVIKAGFATNTTVSTTIYQEELEKEFSPVRMIKIDLDVSPIDTNKLEEVTYELLWRRLSSFDKNFNHRTYKHYELKQEGVGITVYIVKPDQKQYWLPSKAYRDADELYAEISQSMYKSYLGKLPSIKKERKVA